MRPRVSVLMPVRNGGSYLAASVMSILTQSFTSFELIVVDDHSTDGATTSLLEVRDRDPRLEIVENPGSGLVSALNFGIEIAKGDLVARMDADDLALPERLHRQVHFLDCRPDIAVVGAQVAFMNAKGDLSGDVTRLPTEPGDIVEGLLNRGCMLKHPTVVARRSALLSVSGYRAALVHAEDYDLWLRLSETFRLANLPDVLLHYRVHGAQVSAGVNLDQRFSRDLSLMAARARRSGCVDPLSNIFIGLDFRRIDPDLISHCEALGFFPSAYRALAHWEGEGFAPPDARALRAVIMNARGRFLGDDRSYRALSLRRCARQAVEMKDWRVATEAASLAFRMAPGRTLRSLSKKMAAGVTR